MTGGGASAFSVFVGGAAAGDGAAGATGGMLGDFADFPDRSMGFGITGLLSDS